MKKKMLTISFIKTAMLCVLLTCISTINASKASAGTIPTILAQIDN